MRTMAASSFSPGANLYGTSYGRSRGFSINNRVRVYSSANLKNWTLEGELLKSPPDGVYYRPYVVFNPNIGKYVLFYNWQPKLWDGKTGVAFSDKPQGPCAIANPELALSQRAFLPGDGSPFVDEGGTGYFIHTVIGQRHAVRVEQLTRDYLASTGKFSEILARDCEAPVLFRRGDCYYALLGQCCCFCSEGTDARFSLRRCSLGSPNTRRPATLSLGTPYPAANGPPAASLAASRGAPGTTGNGSAATSAFGINAGCTNHRLCGPESRACTPV